MFEFCRFKQTIGTAGLCLMLALIGCEKPSNPKRGTGGSKKDPVAVEEADEAIVDKDYCFRIDSMGTEWKLMPEEEITRILPDALAGAFHASGVYGAVVIEPMPRTDLNAYSEVVRDVMMADGGTMSEFRKVTQSGFPALRATQSMMIRDVPFKLDVVLFVHQEFGVRLISWGQSGRYSTGIVDTFLKAFHVTDGEIKPRVTNPEIADFDGVGRRVLNGQFDSATYRLSVRPPEGWQLMVGVSLFNT